ncbi:MAG: hypothetical protein R3310_14930, partial [Candidatus Competibacteraceae bacterium]|nr:hypothetical protein [Candidatus Competibacteraceae bacterium]
VLVSDGRLDDPAELETALQRLRASAITVHTVAVGDQRPGVDLGISAVTLPDSVLKDATVTARVTLSQRGLAGREIELVVEEDSTIVAQRTLNLPQDDRQPTVDIPLTFTVPGPRRLDFRVGVAAEESLTDNNRLTRLVRVRGDPLQVLHIEGEPRFEVRFLRRAVADDDAIRLASLVRTAEQKYYRLGITGPQELARGLPIDEAQLFPFEVLVLGSADATLVDNSQQRLIQDFVARRGGGLLLLGGSGALAEGGFGGTPLADLLPVVLEEPQQDYRVQVPIRPTEEGRHDPLLQAALPLAPREIEALPALTVVNPLRRAKPGARVLLEADDGTAAPLIVLAYQRYGRGAVATLAVRNTWRWQMQLPLADQTHETLWRALLRGLGERVAKPIEVSLSPTSAVPGESVTVTAEVLDAGFRPLDGGNPTLTVTTPLGEMETLPLKAVPSVIGRYRAGFTATQNGRYDLRVAQGQAQEAQQTEAYLWVDSAGAEFRNPAVAVELLARIARTTGGRILHPEEITQLPELLESTRTTRTVIRRLELWDAPLFLVALLSLIGYQWFYRRQCALA